MSQTNGPIPNVEDAPAPRRRYCQPLVVAAVALVSLAACGPPSEPEVAAPVIVFLGTAEEVRDKSLAAFLNEWRQVAKGRCRSARIRHFASDNDQFPAQVSNARAGAELSPTVIVAPTEGTARAARVATDAPVVFATFLNPVRAGLVSDEGVRAENATGISLDDRLTLKRLEILRQAFPSIRRIGVIVDDAWRQDADLDATLAAAGTAFGLSFHVASAETPQDVASAFDSPEARTMEAWYIPPTEVGYAAERQIIWHLRQSKTPAIHSTVEEVRQGALMAYAQDMSFAYQSLASLANRVCNGEAAGSIPIERPRRFLFSIRADYDLGGRRIAPDVVARADSIE